MHVISFKCPLWLLWLECIRNVQFCTTLEHKSSSIRLSKWIMLLLIIAAVRGLFAYAPTKRSKKVKLYNLFGLADIIWSWDGHLLKLLVQNIQYGISCVARGAVPLTPYLTEVQNIQFQPKEVGNHRHVVPAVDSGSLANILYKTIWVDDIAD